VAEFEILFLNLGLVTEEDHGNRQAICSPGPDMNSGQPDKKPECWPLFRDAW
jgi:hypothetical protein